MPRRRGRGGGEEGKRGKRGSRPDYIRTIREAQVVSTTIHLTLKESTSGHPFLSFLCAQNVDLTMHLPPSESFGFSIFIQIALISIWRTRSWRFYPGFQQLTGPQDKIYKCQRANCVRELWQYRINSCSLQTTAITLNQIHCGDPSFLKV